MPDIPRQRNLAKEINQVVLEGEELQSDLVVDEVVAGQARPLHRVLALAEVGDDEANAGE